MRMPLAIISGLVASLLLLPSAFAYSKSDIAHYFTTMETEPATRGEFLKAVVEMNGGILHSPPTTQHVITDIVIGTPYFGYFWEAIQEDWITDTLECSDTECLALPNESITIRDAAIIISKAFGQDYQGAAPVFTNNSLTMYGGEAVQIMADHCIFTAKSDGKIDAHNPLLTIEAIEILLAVDAQLRYGQDCGVSSSSLSSRTTISTSSSVSSKRSSSSKAPKSSKPVSSESDETHEPVLNFKDIDGHRYEDAIGYLYEHGIVGGYPDGTFKPDAPINRAEFVKIVVLAYFNDARLDMCDPHNIYHFKDASQDAWYSKTLCFAVQHWVIAGYNDNTFRPENHVNAAEAAKIVASTDTLDIAGSPPLEWILDAGMEWYMPFWSYMGERNAIPSTIDSPNQAITRGEMAFMIYALAR